MKAAIAGIPESDWKTFRDGEIAETSHCMNKTDKAFRLIVLRRPREQDLFEDNGPIAIRPAHVKLLPLKFPQSCKTFSRLRGTKKSSSLVTAMEGALLRTF